MPNDSEFKVICFFFAFFCSSLKGVSEGLEFGDQTMGHGTEPTMKVLCFNPGSRLKEKSQDAALNH